MKKFLLFPIKYIKRHLYWQVFIVLMLNLILIFFVGILLSQIFWDRNLQRRINSSERALTSNLINYWENYYDQNNSLPLIEGNEANSELQILWRNLGLNRYRFLLGSEAIESITLYDKNRNIILSFNDSLNSKYNDLLNLDDDFKRFKQPTKAGRIEYMRENRQKMFFSDDNDELSRINWFLERKNYNKFVLIEYPLMHDFNLIGWIEVPSFISHEKTNSSIFLKILGNLFGLIVIVLLITGVMTYLLTLSLIGPIKKINKGLIALEKKDFDYRVNVNQKNELGRLAANFNSMADQIKQFANSRKLWIETISHELKTPLTILRGEIEAMIDGVRSINKKNLKSVQNELIGLTELTVELQELATNEKDFIENNLKKFEINELIIELVNKYQLMFKKNGFALNLDKKDEEIFIYGNKNMVLRAIMKILENCISYSDKGKILLSSFLVDNNWHCTIEDSGPGINEKDFDKIFDYFYQDPKTETKGSGLGLAICRSIILKHKGVVNVEDSKLGGAKFTIIIPIC